MALATPVPTGGTSSEDDDFLRGTKLPESEATLLRPVIESFLRRHPESDTAIIVRAAETASVAHAGQRRRSGEPYITHPIAVSGVVADLGLDAQTVAAALLHDAVEDTGITTEDIERDFGAAVALIVEGVTKLDRLQFDSKEAQQAATVRKMLVAMADDWRVLIIKLADRLHNMRTLAVMPEWKQRRTAQQTLDIYAPLAHRLGIQEIKWQLEDLAFATLHPKRYAEIEQMVASRAPLRDDYLARVLVALRDRLSASGIDAEVTGRPKHLWSIYEKMVVRGKEFDDLYDLVGIRVIVESEKDCWAALGSIHAIWPPVQGRFKDYINSPKFNLYQSLHTTVIGLDGDPIEVQIRTHEMHRRAEYGIAAHWGYKENPAASERPTTAKSQKTGTAERRTRATKPAGSSRSTATGRSTGTGTGTSPKGRAASRPAETNGTPAGATPAATSGRKKATAAASGEPGDVIDRDKKAAQLALAKETSSTTAEIEWMQRIVDFQNETTDPIEFLEALKLDLEEDEVYVFTPKGKVIALTANATPVDFAYAIHTEVGHRCIGAKVNGRLVPLETTLNTADTVEIFTSKSPTAGPSRDWLSVVASSRARTKIRQWFSRERREDAIELGREELVKELRREGLPVQKLAADGALTALCATMNYADLDALYAAVGDNRVSARAVCQRLLPRAAGGHLRGPAAGHRPPAAVAGPAGTGLRRRCLRRGARRPHGPPLALLYAGARGRDRRIRHPRPRGVGPPGRLRQRRLAGQPVPRAAHRSGVGPSLFRCVRGHPRGGGHRPVAPARRRDQGGRRAPPQHRERSHPDGLRPHQPHALRRRAGRPGPSRVGDQPDPSSRRRLRRLPHTPGQEGLSSRWTTDRWWRAPRPGPTTCSGRPRRDGRSWWPGSARRPSWPTSAWSTPRCSRTPGCSGGASARTATVVGKEMYEFEDRGGRLLALRPEGTAPMVRAFVQHRPPVPWKAWYVTPAFRYERPQAGRYRQHHQLGVEALGPADPDLDVEVIVLADGFFRSLGLADFELRINSMGDERVPACLPGPAPGLPRATTTASSAPNTREPLGANPLRVLDCKRPECLAATADAPALVDALCEPCRAHFERVSEGLEAAGVPVTIDHRLVRGFDYYTRTTFEFSSSALEAAQNGIGGGGRYDGLVEMLGGPPDPGDRLRDRHRTVAPRL